MNSSEYNNVKDNLKQLQEEMDRIQSSYNSLVNANKVDLEHINVLNEQLKAIVTKARDELKDVDFLRVSESEEDNVMYDNLQAEKTKITNHLIRQIISQEKNRLDRMVGVKEENGKYSLTDAKRKELKEKLDKKHKYEAEIKYTVQRKDIDVIGHMHNLYYLNLAYEALPEEEYQKRPFDNVRIMYKKEIKLGETVVCKYAKEVEKEESENEGKEIEKNIIAIESLDGTIIHAIIEIY